MYNILLVDDDTTCLTILKSFLQRWKYEVTAVKHAYDALCALRDKSYDLVMSDVHMPNMDGFELQQHINKEYRLPVILISSDPQAESKGVQNGAQCFMIKPIEVNDVKNIWQFSIWWKSKMNNSTPPIRGINIRFQENVPRNRAISSDNILNPRTGKLAWTRNLHSRFVEAVVRLGYHKAVPRNILDIMDVPGLTREQIASHLQKYRTFLQRILDGSIEINNTRWIDFNYHSSVVSGNPHLMLINQLRREKGMGELETPILVGNLSSSSGKKRSLPPSTPTEASSNKNKNAMWMPNNYASSSANVIAGGFGSTALGNSCNANMGNTVGSKITINNPLQNLKYNPNQMGYFNRKKLVAPLKFSNRDKRLVVGANNYKFSLANHIGTSGTAPVPNNFFFNKEFNLGGQGNNSFSNARNVTGNQQLSNGQMIDKNLFTGYNIEGGQVAKQLGAGDSSNNDLFSLENFFLDPNLIHGEEDYWGDILNVDFLDEMDVGVAVEKDAAKSGDNNDDDSEGDDDVDYNPEED